MIERDESRNHSAVLSSIAGFAGSLGRDVYLVGGTVRDILSGRTCDDFDFAIEKGEDGAVRRFAAMAGGSFFWLDEERKQSRVIVKTAQGLQTFDFAPLRGATIQDDLVLRDFTINAMAVCLSGKSGKIIDPLGGRNDIEQRRIRICSANSFPDDPLRLLRAVRFAVILGYRIEEGTWSALTKHVHLIRLAAKERVRDEIFKILAAPRVENSLRLLRKCGLLHEVLPLNASAGAIEAGLRTAGAVEETISRFCGRKDMQAYLDSCTEAGVSISALLKLGGFLKPSVDSSQAALLLADMRLGKRTARLVQLLLTDPRDDLAVLSAHCGERAMYRFFRDREAGPEIVIAASANGTCPVELAQRLIDYYFGGYGTAREELVTGRDIMFHFGLQQGSSIGDAIAMVRQAEASGQVGSKAEALVFLGKKLLTKPGC